jgi:hypothetical protein
VYVFENNIPRCAPFLHLYALFITDQYKKKFYLKLTNIKKNIGQAILVGKCCHCRINKLTLILKIIGQCDVKRFKMLPMKYKNVSFKCFHIHYQTHCNINDNVCLDLQNCHYSPFIIYPLLNND